MKIIEIGSLRIALPSLITVIVGIVIGLVLIIALPNMWHLGIMTMASFFVSSYTINCSVVGRCFAWAWFLMAVLTVAAVASSATLIFAARTIPKPEPKFALPPNAL